MTLPPASLTWRSIEPYRLLPPCSFLAGFHCSMLVPPWAAATRPIGTPVDSAMRHGKRQAQAGPFLPRLVLLGRPLGAGPGISRVDRVRRVDQPVQRLLGLHPLAVHPQQHDPGIGRRDVDQIADALHVGLARQHPEVTHENRPD